VTQERVFPYHRTPSDIRGEVFSHRMRGLDEEEVREYLDLLADQVQASDLERQELLAENDRLRAELERAGSSSQSDDGEISTQAVLLFSQAQEIADQLVEEAVVHARDLMTSARNQQREILEEAHRAADAAARHVAEANGQEVVSAAAGSAIDYSTPVPEIEYVRTFARVAQVQLRSVLDALTEQVEKLGEVPRLSQEGRSWFSQETTTRVAGERSWRVEPMPPQGWDSAS
jgi:cell division initiation protein